MSEPDAEMEGVLQEIERQRNLNAIREDIFTFIERFVIRSLRIAAGGVVLGVALWITDDIRDMSDKPFSSLTMSDLFEFVYEMGFGGLFFYWASAIAFGEGPSQEEIKRRQKDRDLEKASQIIAERRKMEAVIAKWGNGVWGRLMVSLFKKRSWE